MGKVLSGDESYLKVDLKSLSLSPSLICCQKGQVNFLVLRYIITHFNYNIFTGRDFKTNVLTKTRDYKLGREGERVLCPV